jgi:hypothetical protein
MLRRLILLLSTFALTFGLGLTVSSASGLTSVHAAGTSVGTTIFAGRNGSGWTHTAKPSLSASANCTTGVLTFVGSNLVPGSDVWFYSEHENLYLIVTTVAADGSLYFTLPGIFFADTITLGDFAAGADPNQGAAPYYSAKPYSFHCTAP